jgi:hypothetical protein
MFDAGIRPAIAHRVAMPHVITAKPAARAAIATASSQRRPRLQPRIEKTSAVARNHHEIRVGLTSL